MRTIFLTLVAFIICVPEHVFSETRQITLPELVGVYYGVTPTTRIASFNLGFAWPTVVREARISVVGFTNTGILECPDSISGMPRQISWPFELSATMEESKTGGAWFACENAPEQPGQFHIIRAFRPIGDAGWAMLGEGRGEVELRVAPSGYGAECMPVEFPPFALVTEAYLVLEGDFFTPVESPTWEEINAVFESPDRGVPEDGRIKPVHRNKQSQVPVRRSTKPRSPDLRKKP